VRLCFGTVSIGDAINSSRAVLPVMHQISGLVKNLFCLEINRLHVSAAVIRYAMHDTNYENIPENWK